jgi:hypothetical protein
MMEFSIRNVIMMILIIIGLIVIFLVLFSFFNPEFGKFFSGLCKLFLGYFSSFCDIFYQT